MEIAEPELPVCSGLRSRGAFSGRFGTGFTMARELHLEGRERQVAGYRFTRQ
jgi:hypothetical protein